MKDNPTREEAISVFLTARGAQSQKLEKDKSQLMDCLKPYHGGPDYAWHGVVMAGLHCATQGARAGRGDAALYDRIQKFAKYLQKESDKRITPEAPDVQGEFSDFRVNELLLLASNIAFSRPRPRHGRTKSPVPAICIYELAFHYRHCTGKRPGSGDGPFAHFVWLWWASMGNEREYNTVVADVKKAFKSRPGAFKDEA